MKSVIKDYSRFFERSGNTVIVLMLASVFFSGCLLSSPSSPPSIYDGRIRSFYLDGEPCGKIQFRKDGGIAIADCPKLAEAVRSMEEEKDESFQ